MRQRTLITCLAAVPLFATMLAASADLLAKELYRWTDEKGVTHYSDTKPTGVEFERRKIDVDPNEAPAAAEAPPVTPAEGTAQGEDTDAQTAEPAKPVGPSPECLQARSNLDVLNSAPDVSMDTDGDGEPNTLDAEARQRAIEQHQELIRTLCAE